MSIPAQNSYPSTLPDQRANTRRAYDIEQQAYAAVGRSFAAGSEAKSRHLRFVFASLAVVTIMILIALVARLTQENVTSPHALKIAAASKAAPQAASLALPGKAKPVVIIDEKDDAPKRPVVASEPIPPLVLLTPAETQPAPAMAQARPAAALKATVKMRERGKVVAAALKHVTLKGGKASHAVAANSAAARKAARKTPAPVPVKRKVSASAAANALY
ncbi:hypothetical protein [Massilia pseudoviolaceinigra]|uniref:hypothetical protein n=1 Tax=Massilia pseudoviolaceinigra TaxID=3057165 RepID=UPI002796BEFD|nr:hypothetical protein [Massilia sp. CCM 9206]MDQ1924786.1 hypothetical protein [Massilia sp. CCM 9206]